MADVNRLVFAILQFLESQTQNSQIGDEAVESIEGKHKSLLKKIQQQNVCDYHEGVSLMNDIHL